MLNYSNLNKEQIKGIANFLFDIAKAAIISTITVGSLPNDLLFKIIFGIFNLILAFLCLQSAVKFLEKIK
jgi:hypothetical protein